MIYIIPEIAGLSKRQKARPDTNGAGGSLSNIWATADLISYSGTLDSLFDSTSIGLHYGAGGNLFINDYDGGIGASVGFALGLKLISKIKLKNIGYGFDSSASFK